jgi:hypothetical protein
VGCRPHSLEAALIIHDRRSDLSVEGRFPDDITGFSIALLPPFGGEP